MNPRLLLASVLFLSGAAFADTAPSVVVVDAAKLPAAYQSACGPSSILYFNAADPVVTTKGPKNEGTLPAFCASADGSHPTPLPRRGDANQTTAVWSFNNPLDTPYYGLKGKDGSIAWLAPSTTVPKTASDYKPAPSAAVFAPTPAVLRTIVASLTAKPAVSAKLVAPRKSAPSAAPDPSSPACQSLVRSQDPKTAVACLYSDSKERAAVLAVLTPQQLSALLSQTAATKNPTDLLNLAEQWRVQTAQALAPTLRAGALPPTFATAGLSRADALKLYCGKFPAPAAAAPSKTALAQLQGNAQGQATLDGAAPAADPLAADCAKTAAGPAAPPPPMSVVKPVSDLTAAAPPPPGGAPAAGGLIAGAGAAAGAAAAASPATQLHEALGAGVGGLAGLMLGFALLGPAGMALGAVVGVAGGYFVGSKF
jgi:hypothetical protein